MNLAPESRDSRTACRYGPVTATPRQRDIRVAVTQAGAPNTAVDAASTPLARVVNNAPGMLHRRPLLLTSFLLAAAAVALPGSNAEACDYQAGINGSHPDAEAVVAANDAIVLAVLETNFVAFDVEVQLEGASVQSEGLMLVEGRTTFLDSDFVQLDLSPAVLTEGDALTVSVSSQGLSGLEASYTVGPADESPLLPASLGATLDLEFVPFDESDSCGVPDRYRAAVSLDAAIEHTAGQRTRFVQLAFYPADGNPADAVGRSARAVREPISEIFGSFPADEDLATLCAEVSVFDTSGEQEVLLEDCDLCDSFPDLCEPGGGETGGGETDGAETDSGETDGAETEGAETDGQPSGETGMVDSESDSAGGAAGESGSGCSVGDPAAASGLLLLLGLLGIRRRG